MALGAWLGKMWAQWDTSTPRHSADRAARNVLPEFGLFLSREEPSAVDAILQLSRSSFLLREKFLKIQARFVISSCRFTFS
jgi:hypothetical protein